MLVHRERERVSCNLIDDRRRSRRCACGRLGVRLLIEEDSEPIPESWGDIGRGDGGEEWVWGLG